MTFNYDKIAQIAAKQIARFGQDVTIISRTSAAYNVANSLSYVAETSKVVKGLVDKYSLKEVDGNIVQTGDLKLLLSATNLTINTNDYVVLNNGTKCVIKNINTVSPSGVNIIYECQIRK